MNQTITYMKAVGIMLMVCGHTWCSLHYFNQFIYMFHMPLFFFVSGYCFKRSHLDEPKAYLQKRVKSVYWPYVKWSLLFLALHNVFFHLHLYSSNYGWVGNVSHLYGWEEFVWHGVYVVGIMREHEQLLGGYWFLNAMFYGSIIMFFTLKVFKRVEVGLLVNLAICYVLNRINAFVFIYYIGVQPLLASAMMLTGVLFAERGVKRFPWWGVAASLALAFVGSFYWYFEMGMFPYRLSKTFPYFVTAILATWSIYSLLSHVKGENVVTRFLTFAGNNTLTILTWHFVMFKVVSLVIVGIYDQPIERIAEFPAIWEYAYKGWWAVYAVVSFAICCGLAYCNRFIKSSWLKL